MAVGDRLGHLRSCEMDARLVQILDELNSFFRYAANHEPQRDVDFQPYVHVSPMPFLTSIKRSLVEISSNKVWGPAMRRTRAMSVFGKKNRCWAEVIDGFS